MTRRSALVAECNMFDGCGRPLTHNDDGWVDTETGSTACRSNLSIDRDTHLPDPATIELERYEAGTINVLPAGVLVVVAALFAVVAGGPVRAVGGVVVVAAAVGLVSAGCIASWSGWWSPRRGVRR